MKVIMASNATGEPVKTPRIVFHNIAWFSHKQQRSDAFFS